MAGTTPTRDQVTDQDTELWKALDNKDLYKVLGVPSDASAKDIERAYRRKARDVHPDKHSDALSTERFKELSAAKELLLDVGRRWWYDQRREKEADVIARALAGAKLRAKAQEEERTKETSAHQERETGQGQASLEHPEEIAAFIAKAHAQALKNGAEEGDSSDDDAPNASKLRASAEEFVPAATRTDDTEQLVEVFSISAQKWCPGVILSSVALPAGLAALTALTVRYQVSPTQWHDKMLYDNDPNLRRLISNRTQPVEKKQLRADAPAFVPEAARPKPPPQGLQQTRSVVRPGNVGPVAPPRVVQIQVTVPPGCNGGQRINIVTPDGRPLTVQIPVGLHPGQTFLVTERAVASPNVFNCHPGQPQMNMEGRPPAGHPPPNQAGNQCTMA